MLGLSDNVARLAALRKTFAPQQHTGIGRLSKLAECGRNPGGLTGFYYVPSSLTERAPLVVVLHGCTQTAAGYDMSSGWSEMADRHGFAVLFPEQSTQNNPNRCFNWFNPGDNRRGRGEALSILEMIEAMSQSHAIDGERVFVTGLSAGGAMANVMLATYPEVFASGAIIAGLPYGCAMTVADAFRAMRGDGGPTAAELPQLVARASTHSGSWPTVSVWQGTSDTTVDPVNAGRIAEQWRALHRLGTHPTQVQSVNGYPRRVWCDPSGREVIEEFSITGMGHGAPLKTRGDEACGASAAFMIEAGISSTHHICRFWGLLGEESLPRPAPALSPKQVEQVPSAASDRMGWTAPRLVRTREGQLGQKAGGEVGEVIANALRAAGLMR